MCIDPYVGARRREGEVPMIVTSNNRNMLSLRFTDFALHNIAKKNFFTSLRSTGSRLDVDHSTAVAISLKSIFLDSVSRSVAPIDLVQFVDTQMEFLHFPVARRLVLLHRFTTS